MLRNFYTFNASRKTSCWVFLGTLSESIFKHRAVFSDFPVEVMRRQFTDNINRLQNERKNRKKEDGQWMDRRRTTALNSCFWEKEKWSESFCRGLATEPSVKKTIRRLCICVHVCVSERETERCWRKSATDNCYQSLNGQPPVIAA